MDPYRRAVHPPARVLTWAIIRGAAWEAVALALAAFETAVDYASTRRQFGKTLTSSQFVQARIANMLSPDDHAVALQSRG
jgi:glutaryl-CoA dehydrogenase